MVKRSGTMRTLPAPSRTRIDRSWGAPCLARQRGRMRASAAARRALHPSEFRVAGGNPAMATVMVETAVRAPPRDVFAYMVAFPTRVASGLPAWVSGLV